MNTFVRQHAGAAIA